jgi:hypothetical protein
VPGVTSRQAQPRRQQPGQRGEEGPVGPVWLRLGNLPPEYRDLVTEHDDPGILDAWPRPSKSSQRIMIR